MKRIKRKVVDTSTRMNPGHEKLWAVGGSVTATLECGHLKVFKCSQVIPPSTVCHECESLQRSGGHRTKIGDAPWVLQYLDPVTGMPTQRDLTPDELKEMEKDIFDRLR